MAISELLNVADVAIAGVRIAPEAPRLVPDDLVVVSRRIGGVARNELLRRLGAEFIGTFMLVSAVCGAALFSALTALFLIVIIGVTSKKAPAGFAPIAIGLTLTFMHLAAIPVSEGYPLARPGATALCTRRSWRRRSAPPRIARARSVPHRRRIWPSRSNAQG
jgi:hypothetical protein